MKRSILIVLVLLLFIPKIQERLNLFEFNKLTGVAENTNELSFSYSQWFDGIYQLEYDSYHSQNFGFRNFLIRLYNQIDYSLFNKTHAEVVVGKEGYLFQEKYLNDLAGISFIGNSSMKNQMHLLSEIQEYLSSKNILLLTVLAPGKPYYYYQYVPDYYKKNVSKETNYKDILKFGSEENINLIDFNKWFLDLRDTSSVQLFPKYGIHWNYYGMALCADSILKYIEEKKNVQLNNFKWSLEYPDKPYGTDYDIGDLLNILYTLPFQKTPVPRFEFQNDTANKKLNILTIGDSFYWTIMNEKIFSNAFKTESYYYYCAAIYPPNSTPSSDPADLNFLKEIEKYDVILLLQTSANYHHPGVNFIPSFNLQMEFKKRYLTEAYTSIDTSATLKNIVNHLSIVNKITADSAKAILADSLSENKMNAVSEIKIKMRNNPEWLASLKLKCAANNTTLEKTMQSDAEWMLSNK